MKGILIVIALFVACNLQAQMDVIVLKNGSEIRGIILEETTETIKLKTKDGSIWVFKKEEVLEKKPFRPIPLDKGYYGALTFGALGGSEVSANLTMVNGYQISPHWGVGLGIGIESFYGRPYLPLFAEGRFNILKSGSTPFLNLGLGYDIVIQDLERNKGGFLAQGLIGFKHELGTHFGIMTGIGFRYSRLRFENSNWWGFEGNDMITINEINRFDLRFGFIFR